MKTLNSFLSLALVFFTLSASAQINTPKPSPLAKSSQVFGLNEVSVEYSRPGVKGRTIFGELLPYGNLWRTGANAPTRFTFKDDVKVNGEDLAAGTYSFLSIPGEESWELIFNKDVNAGEGSYDAAKNALTLKVPTSTPPLDVERFTISFDNMTDNSVDVKIAWEKTQVEFNLTTEVESIVMKEIETATSGVSARTYYDAAMYYFTNNKDLKKALEWVTKAIDSEKPSKFWMLHNKAKIQAALGDYKNAIKTAEASIELSKKSGNAHYVMLNENAIKEWRSKK